MVKIQCSIEILNTSNILSLFYSYSFTLGMHLTLANDCPIYRLTSDYVLESCGFSNATFTFFIKRKNFYSFNHTANDYECESLQFSF